MSLEFLRPLLEAAGPSGSERRAADVWRREAETFADRVYEDHYGNVYAEIGPQDAAPVALLGHIDEIGLMVSHVDDKGHVAVLGVGGWDPQVLVGQRVRLLAPGGDLLAVVGKKAIHLMDTADREKASKMEDLWLDTGLTPDEVRERVPVGTVGVVEQPVVVIGERVVSRALDNRIGAYVVLEALRAAKERGAARRVVAVATAQEEIGLFGAQVASFRLEPEALIAVDVTHETDQPGANEKKLGRAPFGSGANLSVGAMSNPVVVRALQAAAAKENIPYSLSANPRYTGTDSDSATLTRAGVPSAVVSIPERYMHSPSEMVDLHDVRACINIIAAWVSGHPENVDYTRK